jgi:hypothetical protein
MKMKRNVVLVSTAIVFSVLMWQCSKDGNSVNPVNNLNLKESLNSGVENVNQAISAIQQTEGYKVLMMNGSNLKSTADSVGFQDSITFNAVKGIYEFQPMQMGYDFGHMTYRLFQKTGDSDLFVVKLPRELAMHPHRLRDINFSDSSLTNNFVITASDYHYYFTNGFLYDYRLMAGIDIDSMNIGDMDIQSSRRSVSDYNYTSKYTFSNGYNISASVTSGDTINSSFTLSNDTTTLLKESVDYIPTSNSWHHERNYMLTIGNVEFRKYSGADSVQVYLNGVLQNNATIQFIDSSDSTGENTVCHRNRDIQVTFDDGTTTTFSALIGPSLDALSGLVDSMHNIYFASNLVDYIAWDIYNNSN